MNYLFDLYGTLIDIRTDEKSGAFWKKISAMCNGKPVKERYAVLCAAQALPEGGEIDLLTVMQKITEEFGCAYSAAKFAEKFREASIKKLRLFDGTNELLATIRRTGGKLYLLSNAQACFTRGELEKLDLADKFDGIMLSSEIGFKKPSKKFFDIAFEKFGLSPKECVYIGNDLRDDVEGARRAGMRSIYIPTAQSGRYPEKIEPDVRVKNHKELIKLLSAR